MAVDEGIAKRNGENLNIQCLLMELDKSKPNSKVLEYLDI